MNPIAWLVSWWHRHEPLDVIRRRESLHRLANPPRGTLGWIRRHNYEDDRYGKVSPLPWKPRAPELPKETP